MMVPSNLRSTAAQFSGKGAKLSTQFSRFARHVGYDFHDIGAEGRKF
jgi:hypothetical protein